MTPDRRHLLGLGAAALTATAARKARAADPGLFEMWRSLYASTEETEVYWWFFGTMSARAEGLPDLPAAGINSLRVCRVKPAPDAVTVTWKEIGYYADLGSEAVATHWRNPVTGERLPTPHAFEQGVGTYTFKRGDAAPGLKEKWSRPWRTELSATRLQAGVMLTQTEVKTRAFPTPDGASPDISERAAVVNDYRFHMFAADADLAKPSAPAAGQFEILFGGAPDWMRFPGRVTRAVAAGAMYKSAPSTDAFPIVSERLRAVYPDYFRKGKVSWD